jgi:hypothetical protein
MVHLFSWRRSSHEANPEAPTPNRRLECLARRPPWRASFSFSAQQKARAKLRKQSMLISTET